VLATETEINVIHFLSLSSDPRTCSFRMFFFDIMIGAFRNIRAAYRRRPLRQRAKYHFWYANTCGDSLHDWATF
jgi:hypothetical protein